MPSDWAAVAVALRRGSSGPTVGNSERALAVLYQALVGDLTRFRGGGSTQLRKAATGIFRPCTEAGSADVQRLQSFFRTFNLRRTGELGLSAERLCESFHQSRESSMLFSKLTLLHGEGRAM
jgi:hypothetical protein